MGAQSVKAIEDVDFLAFVAQQEQQYLVGLDADRDGIAARFATGVTHYGDTLPWDKTHEKFRLRPAEVTLWCGINGHGKSLVSSHIVAHLLDQGHRCVLASMEMSIEASGHRLIRQILGSGSPREDVIHETIDWCCDNRLWVYDQLDTVASDRILGMAIYAMSELGIKHVVIDSLMKCGIGPEDYEKQSAFIDRLCWAAKTYHGHIHLIHHVRKGEDEFKVPNKFDVKGSGAITDMVDNVVIVWRNKAKERRAEHGKATPEDHLVPDTVLNVEKQRHGEWEGGINLYFHLDSNQYLSGPDRKPRWYGPAAEKIRGVTH
jgi:twinkle protein